MRATTRNITGKQKSEARKAQEFFSDVAFGGSRKIRTRIIGSVEVGAATHRHRVPESDYMLTESWPRTNPRGRFPAHTTAHAIENVAAHTEEPS